MPEVDETTTTEETKTTETDAETVEGSKDDSKKAPKRIQVFRSGWMNEPDFPEWGWQGRAFTQEYLRQICENTATMEARAGLRVPILRGHPELEWFSPEQKQAVEGWLSDFRCEDMDELDPQGNPQVMVTAAYEMSGDLAEDFDSGKLPKRSPYIELFGGKLPDGRAVGPYFKNLALLGKDTPAMGAMMDSGFKSTNFQVQNVAYMAFKQSQNQKPVKTALKESLLTKLGGMIQDFKDAFAKLFTKPEGTAALAKEGYAVDKDELKMKFKAFGELGQAVLDYAAECMAAIEEMDEEEVEETEEGTEDTTGETTEPAASANTTEEEDDTDGAASKKANGKKPPKLPKKAATPGELSAQRELAKVQLEKEKLLKEAALAKFESLVTTGQIYPGKKDDFMEVAVEKGLAKAVQFFAGEEVESPVTGRTLPAPTHKTVGLKELEAEEARLREEGMTNTYSYKDVVARIEKLRGSKAGAA